MTPAMPGESIPKVEHLLKDDYQPHPAPPGLDAAPNRCFSWVVIPDTQEYVSIHPSAETEKFENPILETFTDWIASESKRQRIAMVSHVGDVVGKNVAGQWRAASHYLSRLDDLVPYGISPGNRDMTSTGDTTLYQHAFPASRFEKQEWYGGSYLPEDDRDNSSGNNVNSFQRIAVGEHRLVFLHLECNAPSNVLAWANQILADHHDSLALVTTHAFLGPVTKPAIATDYYDGEKGRMKWCRIQGTDRSSPEMMWQSCFQHHANVRMICCGDQRRTTAWRMTRRGVHGNLVHACLTDYSPLKELHREQLRGSQTGRLAKPDAARVDPLRIYRFHLDKEQIEAITYDPIRDQRVTQTASSPHADQHQFVLPCPRL